VNTGPSVRDDPSVRAGATGRRGADLGPMRFELSAQDGAARRGRLEFPRGSVETPAFMPVGTYGTVKAMTPEDLEGIGVEIVLGNTFHLYLRPGLEVIAAHQGLHGFMHWRRPILTDSGGFQVWSLAEMRKITEEGAHFRSPVDGAQVFLSPEESMRIQRTLASDVAMSFDECTPYPATEAEARASMELSMRWALRGFREYYRSEPPGTLFGIVQGGVHRDLRLASLAALEEIGFAGLAVGGLAVGESVAERDLVLDGLLPHMPRGKPRYLMGVGRPEDIIEAVRRGIDMFDCVMPTRNGRHGMAFTRFGQINLRNARHADDPRPLDEESNWPSARDISRSYLHHLVRSGETLGAMLLSEINIAYYQQLMQGMRAAIAAGRFDECKKQTRADWARGDIAQR
jgi:queuine tRNA-ribosyltransferase